MDIKFNIENWNYLSVKCIKKNQRNHFMGNLKFESVRCLLFAYLFWPVNFLNL